MSIRPLHNYIRTYRRRAGLSQEELAFLLELKDGSAVSRHENSVREPSRRNTLSYAVALGTSVEELFAIDVREVGKRTNKQVRFLITKITEEPDTLLKNRKLAALRALLD